MTVKFETKHKVKIGRKSCVPLEIVITKVQELGMAKNPNDDKSYRARSGSDDALRKGGRLSWNCSIVPTEVNQKLKANADLEVGELAGWDVANVMGLEDSESLLMPGLMNTVNQIIVKMDAVGSRNGNE